MQGIGLVLAGGGGKGAYQIGVWKYLRDKGLDRYICGVSGTSVGALNAALFASGDYNSAERIWKNISSNQILTPRKVDSILGLQLNDFGGVLSTKIPLMGLSSVIPNSQFLTAINYSVCQSPFSREGLIKIMRNKIDLGMLQHSHIPCYATCLELPQLARKRFELRRFAKKDIETILLASSAIPIVFDSVLFQGKYYCDGGLQHIGDNVPVMPLYSAGVRFFVVVQLNQKAHLDKSMFPGATIVEIVPQVDLGGALTGTLDFSSSGSAWRMKQGYADAERVFRAYSRASR